MAYIEELFSDHFLQYASYVIRERAIPSLDDGLKPVQRRIMQSLWDMDDGKFHKVANVVGHCMQYHPHGDASIYGALVNLANKELFIVKQGNFGNIHTGDPASAARYIECRLSPLAHRTLFNPEVTQFLPSYDGRRNEPIAFPAKLPFLLILGAEGIAVGMSTRILPHNFSEVIGAMCAVFQGQEFELLPDFLTGGLVDTSEYHKGSGKILSRARLQCRGNQIVICELPCGVTTEALITSLEAAVKKNRIKVQSIQNFTAEEVEIVLQLPRGVPAEEQLESLYAFSDCEVSISCNLLTIDEKHPIQMDTDSVLRYSCQRLKDILQAELKLEAEQLRQQIFTRKLERIFIEDRLYKPIETLARLAEIEVSILSGLAPYCAEGGELGRKVRKEELAALLQIPIRRISLYDIGRMRKELRELGKRLRQVQRHLEKLTEYALSYLLGLQQEFGQDYPRKTELSRFTKVAIRRAAPRDQWLRYDPEEGFLGYSLKEGKKLFFCSPYDRILLLRRSGSYTVLNVPEKLFTGSDFLFSHLADKESLAKLDCAVLYEEQGYVYGKRFRFGGYILGKEYRIVPEGCEIEIFAATCRERSAQWQTREKERLKENLQETSGIEEPVQALRNLSSYVGQPEHNVAAFAVLFRAEKPNKSGGHKDRKKKLQEAELWHYRFGDLPEKSVKAKGALLRKQKLASAKILSQEQFAALRSGSQESKIVAAKFPVKNSPKNSSKNSSGHTPRNSARNFPLKNQNIPGIIDEENH